MKLGFQVALKLLRDGAHVLITSRFPHDAARRYACEPDFESWRERLVIHELDLHRLPRVQAFIHHLLSTEPYLDILINNAAQTVRLPREQEAVLHQAEEHLGSTLEAPAQALLGTEGSLEDLRSRNSWVLRLGEVPVLEAIEVQVVNAIAPFLLNGQLKPLLLRSPHPDRYIINVTAAEGQFQREGKTVFHPHTNMAKAALNMLTRTSAADYARSGIYMNSVDPGWFSNENPHDKRQRMEAQGFHTPLDCVDGAARVYDPIIQGIQGQPVYGQLLKNYQSVPW